MALAYYEHRMLRGADDYARQANWALDTTMAHYGNPPAILAGVMASDAGPALPTRLIRYLRRHELPIVALTAMWTGIATARVVLDNQGSAGSPPSIFWNAAFRHLAFYKCTTTPTFATAKPAFAAAEAEAVLDYMLELVLASQPQPSTHPSAAEAAVARLASPLGVMAQSDHRAYSC